MQSILSILLNFFFKTKCVQLYVCKFSVHTWRINKTMIFSIAYINTVCVSELVYIDVGYDANINISIIILILWLIWLIVKSWPPKRKKSVMSVIGLWFYWPLEGDIWELDACGRGLLSAVPVRAAFCCFIFSREFVSDWLSRYKDTTQTIPQMCSCAVLQSTLDVAMFKSIAFSDVGLGK